MAAAPAPRSRRGRASHRRTRGRRWHRRRRGRPRRSLSSRPATAATLSGRGTEPQHQQATPSAAAAAAATCPPCRSGVPLPRLPPLPLPLRSSSNTTSCCSCRSSTALTPPPASRPARMHQRLLHPWSSASAPGAPLTLPGPCESFSCHCCSLGAMCLLRFCLLNSGESRSHTSTLSLS
jgi:hypothetical protein